MNVHAYGCPMIMTRHTSASTFASKINAQLIMLTTTMTYTSNACQDDYNE